jgi:hypothetical protein
MSGNPELSLFVVEYSLSQRAFNVATLEDIIRTNIRMIVQHHRSNDYLVVGVARTHSEANDIVNLFRSYLEKGEWPEILYFDE